MYRIKMIFIGEQEKSSYNREKKEKLIGCEPAVESACLCRCKRYVKKKNIKKPKSTSLYVPKNVVV